MSAPGDTPKNIKGALVGVDIFGPLTSIVVFQYNPEKITRTITPKYLGEDADKTESLRLKGAPKETLEFEIEFKAKDGGEPLGVLPRLSSLELLGYPKSPLIIANTALMFAGTMEIIPPTGPFTLLVWGPSRVLPVRVKEFAITEDYSTYASALHPPKAKAKLKLDVLTYNDLSIKHPGYYIYLAHQIYKEVLGTAGSIQSIAEEV